MGHSHPAVCFTLPPCPLSEILPPVPVAFLLKQRQLAAAARGRIVCTAPRASGPYTSMQCEMTGSAGGGAGGLRRVLRGRLLLPEVGGRPAEGLGGGHRPRDAGLGGQQTIHRLTSYFNFTAHNFMVSRALHTGRQLCGSVVRSCRLQLIECIVGHLLVGAIWPQSRSRSLVITGEFMRPGPHYPKCSFFGLS